MFINTKIVVRAFCLLQILCFTFEFKIFASALSVQPVNAKDRRITSNVRRPAQLDRTTARTRLYTIDILAGTAANRRSLQIRPPSSPLLTPLLGSQNSETNSAFDIQIEKRQFSVGKTKFCANFGF